MISLLLVLLGGCGAWYRPVLGYALFMLLQTPLLNVAGSLAHPYLDDVLLVVATVKLGVRIPVRSTHWRLYGLEVCALVFSLIVLIRQVQLNSFYLTSGTYMRALFSAFLWGPLLVALNRLDEKEMDKLRFWMGMAGIVVGIWGTLVYLTGNGYLIRTSIWVNPETITQVEDSLINSDEEQLVANRFIVMGLFTVVTYSYWYVLRGVFSQNKRHWLWNIGMYAGCGVMLMTAGISVTRSTVLLLGVGTVFMLVGQLLVKGGGWHNQLRVFAIMFMGVILLIILLLNVDLSVMMEEFQRRFSILGRNDDSVIGRLENTSDAWDFISKTLCPFGASNPEAISSVDTAVALRVWITYGLFGVALFSVLFLVAFGNLFSCWLFRRLNPDNQLLRNMLTAWALAYVYVWLVGYSMHPPEIFFTMLFVSEVTRLKCKCKAIPNYGPRWVNA